MEFTHLETPIENINFNDVMKIIASKDTNYNDKMVYIYLLNVIMDTNERLDKLENLLKVNI